MHGVKRQFKILPYSVRSYTGKPNSVAEDICQRSGTPSLNTTTVKQSMYPSDDEEDENDCTRAAVLEKNRRVEKINELMQCIMILEQEEIQTQNEAAWKGKFTSLKNTFYVLQVGLSLKRRNNVERAQRSDKKTWPNVSDEHFRWQKRRVCTQSHSFMCMTVFRIVQINFHASYSMLSLWIFILAGTGDQTRNCATLWKTW